MIKRCGLFSWYVWV